MRFSFELPTHRVDQDGALATGRAVAELTAAAAAAGFDAVNVSDHPAPDARWLDHGGHHALDPFVALSFAAASDDRVRLLTNIYVAAYRNPFLGAKQVHSLHLLSGGRLILGVAAGYLRPEFAALGADFDRRGEVLDDALEVLDELFGGGDVARQSERYQARGVRFRPTLGSRPPIWVGGNSRAAIRRAARFDGWAPFHTAGFAQASRTAPLEDIDDLRAAIAEVRRLAASRGGNGAFDVCWSEALTEAAISADERCARVDALAGAGVTWMTVALPGTDVAEVADAVARFGSEVVGATRSSAP